MRDVEAPVVTTSVSRVYNTYSRHELYNIRTLACRPTSDLIDRVRELGLCVVDRTQRRRRFHFTRYRGRRAGRRQRPVPSLRAVGNGVSVITGNKRQRSADRLPSARVPTLIHIHTDRHVATSDTLTFGCINIRSIANKVDDLLQVRTDHSVDVVLLTETWHDKN